MKFQKFALFLSLVSSLSFAAGPLDCLVILHGIATPHRGTAKKLEKLDRDTMNSYQFVFPVEAQGEVTRDLFKILNLPPLTHIFTEGLSSGIHFQKIFPEQPVTVSAVVTSGSTVKIYTGQLKFIQFRQFFYPDSGAFVRKIEIKEIGISKPDGETKVLASDITMNSRIADIRIGPREIWTSENARELFENRFRKFKVLEEGNPRFPWVAKDQRKMLERPALVGKKVAILFRKRSTRFNSFDFLNQPVFVEGTLLRLNRSTFQLDPNLSMQSPYHGFSIQEDNGATKQFGFTESGDVFQLVDILEIRYQ